MKYSINWLNDFCPIEISVEELAETLTNLGLEVESFEKIDDDYVLDIDVTPDRSYALSVIGLAGEVALGTSTPRNIPEIEYKSTTRDKPGIEVIVEDKELCPLYVARVIEGVTIGDGPAQMAKRLNAIGMRPIDIAVDITNYVMAETGQPFHAFDKAKLAGGKIIVRRAKPNEPMTLLDGTRLKLCTDDLVIADAERPIALAGVMGGVGSGIDESTTDIVLEIAYFNPTTVRRTAKRYNLASESSYRFERGINPDGVIAASNRAVAQFAKLAGGTVIAPNVIVGKTSWQMPEINLRTERVNRVLGTKLTTDEIEEILTRLYLETKPDGNNGLIVTPPGNRRDLSREIDLIEDIGRVFGYNNIKGTLPGDEFPKPERTAKIELFDAIRNVLTGIGFYETYNNILVSEEHINRYDEAKDSVALLNPLSTSLSHLRNSVWSQLAETADYNARRGIAGMLLFEMGTVFYTAKNAKLELYDIKREGYGESIHLAIIGGGVIGDYHWQQNLPVVDFYFIKGTLGRLATALNLPQPEYKDGEISVGNLTGSYRTLNIDNLPHDLVAIELDITPLVKSGIVPLPKIEAIPRFPSIERDLALLVDQNIAAGELICALEGSDELLASVGIFDEYHGKGIPGGKKSIGVRLRYRADDRTLTDEDVNNAREAALEILINKYAVTLRK